MGCSFFRKLLDDDSDEDEIIIKLLTGSTPQRKHRRYIERNHLASHRRLYDDYFAEEPVYPPNLFQRRFRMRRSLFLRILSRVEAHEPYFTQKRNAAKKLGLSPLQKMTAALRMLTYGVAADFMDEYVRIAETTAITSLKKFVVAVVAIFSEEYLRSPNNEDIARLLAHGQNRGFPGMLGSINCMHWKWKNCPTAWKGMYCGHIREPINYSINGDDYTMGYYLADGIYPQWSTFVKTIPRPLLAKRKLFAKAQEAYRKDVERAFGVLQARFAIVRGPARFFYHETLHDIMKACIILHNMIIEDERDEAEAMDLDYEQIDEISCTPMSREPTNEFTEFIQLSSQASQAHSLNVAGPTIVNVAAIVKFRPTPPICLDALLFRRYTSGKFRRVGGGILEFSVATVAVEESAVATVAVAVAGGCNCCLL
ncbi:uncharacterized protein LOC126705100 [Quercus robur]|uniref:uncharacterized protein LOC126705100 n=1 Tax=Quercus robur TaxID=38942 RepID=UPI0021626278|nr:uncharacterized protein LOC126705100 [Quercus robur]